MRPFLPLLLTTSLLACANPEPTTAVADAALAVDGSAPQDTTTHDAPAAQDAAQAQPCNGAVELCSRRFDQVALACTHNAMSAQDEGWMLPNQPHGLLKQLDDGIRALMLDVHVYQGDDPALQDQTVLCHGVCALGARRLDEAMKELRQWLQGNPLEVLAIVFEDHVPEARLAKALQAAELVDLCAVHSPTDAKWPTLQEMIASGQRLVIMTESGQGQLPWNHAYQELAWDTPYAAETAADLKCELLRGKTTNSLFVINHFLTKGLTAHWDLAELVNHDPFLTQRLQACAKQMGRLPNLVAVDWYTTGDVLEAVRTLNGLP